MSSSGTITQSTGVDITYHSIIWEIKNFHVILKDDKMINSERMDFDAMDGNGQQTKWLVYLRTEEKEGTKWIGIFYMPQQRPPINENEYLYSQIHFAIKTKDGKSTWSGESQINDASLINLGVGFSKMIDVGQFKDWGSLQIHISFKLYSPAKQTSRGQEKEEGDDEDDSFSDYWKRLNLKSH